MMVYQRRHLEIVLSAIVFVGIFIGLGAGTVTNSEPASFFSAFTISALFSLACKRFFGEWTVANLSSNAEYALQLERWFSARWRPFVSVLIGIAFGGASLAFNSLVLASLGGALVGSTLAFFAMKSAFDFQGNTHERTR